MPWRHKGQFVRRNDKASLFSLALPVCGDPVLALQRQAA